MKEELIRKLNLRLFDGGAAGAGAGTGGTGAGEGDGQAAATEAATEKAENPVQTTEQVDRKAEYAKLKSEYKAEYDNDVQQIVKSRLRDMKRLQDENAKLTQFSQKIAERYGLDATDYDGLTKALESDTSYIKQRAREEGLSEEQMAKQMAMEAQIAQFTRQKAEQDAQAQFNQRMQILEEQSSAVQQIYPDFDFRTEMEVNKDFRDMVLRNNLDVKTAYEVTHMDEILNGGINAAYKAAQQKTIDSIRAKGNRPQENGTTYTPAADKKIDISSRKAREELARRAARGERIVL